ncbi:Hypothetical protein POVN_LOCUS451 [uncultured virus]|nr:Hypothetical protein POVN_LOCUS451 [uncultured virus]
MTSISNLTQTYLDILLWWAASDVKAAVLNQITNFLLGAQQNKQLNYDFNIATAAWDVRHPKLPTVATASIDAVVLVMDPMDEAAYGYYAKLLLFLYQAVRNFHGGSPYRFIHDSFAVSGLMPEKMKGEPVSTALLKQLTATIKGESVATAAAKATERLTKLTDVYFTLNLEWDTSNSSVFLIELLLWAHEGKDKRNAAYEAATVLDAMAHGPVKVKDEETRLFYSKLSAAYKELQALL